MVTRQVDLADTINADIDQYIQDTLQNDPKWKYWNDWEGGKIETTLMKGANGIILLVVDTQSLTHFFRFRWVVCQFDMLQNCINPFMMEEALRNLPPTLDKTYERILESIHESHRRYAQKLLQWLSFSARPLQIKELTEVLVIDFVEEQPIYDTKHRLRNPRDILTICSSLVSSPTSDDGEIRLAHFSVREYLISTRITERLTPFFSFI